MAADFINGDPHLLFLIFHFFLQAKYVVIVLKIFLNRIASMFELRFLSPHCIFSSAGTLLQVSETIIYWPLFTQH